MAYEYISLPIELASNGVISKMHGTVKPSTLLIVYVIDLDISGFSSILSKDGIEYICKSEEEFFDTVAKYKLMHLITS